MPPVHTGDEPDVTPVRDAACLVLVDRSQVAPRLLLGRRLATQVFLPNKWVFPGGRVDDDDRALARFMSEASGIGADEAVQVPFALAAVRETFEETGIVVGSAIPPAIEMLPASWQPFCALGLMPDFNHLQPLARAITPPGLPRRFDTWFFIREWLSAKPADASPDGELLDLDWFTLDQVRALDLPVITRLIVDDVASRIAADISATAPQIPFYFQDSRTYRRVLIDARGPFVQS
jgi:8-oxo-dGTP pyrophosphatase MutT (NUDIX family)